ncbi:MAG: L,D-transpeptidase [Thermoleophilia bacterium]
MIHDQAQSDYGTVTLGREATKELTAPQVGKLASRIKLAVIIAGGVAALAVVATLLLVVVLPPRINVNPGDGSSEIIPDESGLEISTSRWGASLATVAVKESRIAPDGTRENERLLSGHLTDGRFVLEDGSSPLVADAEYSITITGTVKEFGISGITDSPVEQTITFTTVTTPMPIIPKDGLKVKYGEEVTLEWNIPISDFDYTLEGIQSTSRLEDGGRVAHIALAKFEQGKEFPLKVTGATSSNGRELKAPLVSKVTTAPPLQLVFEPTDGTSGASTEANPAIIFSEPVSNQDLARTLVTIEPKVEGTFSWPAPNRLEFKPTNAWDHLQDVTVSLKSGPQALRGISGGFLEADSTATFTTAPAKAIDVDISEQTVTLLENGVAVESFLASTGSSGTDTPLGDYTIYAKMSAIDMRGPGYFAPKVPWVMVFKGDYTMHGNYWATSFGQRSSHGCVGLPVETAKHVYDWTPIGTPIHIHD